MCRLAFSSLCALLASATSLASAPDALPPEIIRLAVAKRQVAATLAQMPDYTCIETVERQETSAVEGEMRIADLIRVEVAFVNGREVYALPGKASFSNQELSRLIGSGFTASGLFATFTRGIFLHGSAYRFTFGASETIDGTPAFRYDYASNVGAESWTLGWAHQSGQVGERGSFWLDARDLRLLRLTVSATNIPSNLPYSRVDVSIDYALTIVSGRSTTLPQRATVNAASFARGEWTNRVDFSQCHRFEVSTKVLGDETPETMVEKAFGNLLPPGVEIAVELVTPIAGASASTGGSVEAKVVQAVNKAGLSLAAGSRLHGRLRRLLPLARASGGYLLSIEFDSVETSGGTALFVATLTSATPTKGVELLKGSRQRGSRFRCKGVFGPELKAEECGAAVPGVVNFVLGDNLVSLSPGLKMYWKTGGFEAVRESRRK